MTPRSRRHRNGDASPYWPKELRRYLTDIAKLDAAAQSIATGGGEGSAPLGIVIGALGGETGEGLLLDTEVGLPCEPTKQQLEDLREALAYEYGSDADRAFEQYHNGDSHFGYMTNLQALNRHFSRRAGQREEMRRNTTLFDTDNAQWSIFGCPASTGFFTKSHSGYWAGLNIEEDIAVPVRWSDALVYPNGCGGSESQPLDQNGLAWAVGYCLLGGVPHR